MDMFKNYDIVNGEYVTIDPPIPVESFGAYRHSFACPLKKAIKSWGCLWQILKFQRFYHSVCGKDMKYVEDCATKFPLLLLPIVYIYSIIDTGLFHKIIIIKN